MARSAIGPVVEVTDPDTIEQIKAALDQDISMLEFAINGDGLRVKVNYGHWSPPMGQLSSEEW
jgi:hypothetical protein